VKRLFNIVLLLIIVGIAGVYFLWGPSALMGGPKNSDIIAVARAAMVTTAPDGAAADLARAAKITPKGLCNSGTDGTTACTVTVETTGTPAQTFVATMKKGPDGAWVAAE